MFQQSYGREVQVRRAWQPCFRPLLAFALELKVWRTRAASAQYLTFIEAKPSISKSSLVLVFRMHMFQRASVDLAQPGRLWVQYGLHGCNMGAICVAFPLPTPQCPLFLGTVWPSSTTPIFTCWKPPASSSHFHQSKLKGLKEGENLLLLLGDCTSVLPL